jgi:hypothetical protein
VPARGAIGMIAAKERMDMMGSASGQMARRVDHRRNEERFPDRFPAWKNLMSAWLQRNNECGILLLPVEQEIRIVRIGDMVDISECDTSFLQTIVNGVEREFVGGKGDGSFRVFDVCEAFFLNGGDYSTIMYQTGGRVVIRGVDAKRVHRLYSSG